MLEAVVSLKRTSIGGSLSSPQLHVTATVAGRVYGELAYNLAQAGGAFLHDTMQVALDEEEKNAHITAYKRDSAGILTDELYWFLMIDIPNPQGTTTRVAKHLNSIQDAQTHCLNTTLLLYSLLWTAAMENPDNRKLHLIRWSPTVMSGITVDNICNYLPPEHKFTELDTLITGLHPSTEEERREPCLSIRQAESQYAQLPT